MMRPMMLISINDDGVDQDQDDDDGDDDDDNDDTDDDTDDDYKNLNHLLKSPSL